MCKQCELRGIKMVLNPLPPIDELKKSTVLPKPWYDMEKAGFREDLMHRAYSHMAWTIRGGNEREIGNARAFLAATGKGFFTEKFNRKFFEEKIPKLSGILPHQALDALQELSDQFGDSVTSVMWDALAHLATRPNPEEKKSILKEQDTLNHHYGVVDTMLHAMGKVYSFQLHVQSVFFKHTGHVLIHNCDCNCSLVNLRKAYGNIEFQIRNADEEFEATQSLFSHMLAESELILNRKLPFEYTITGDAKEVLGAEAVSG